MQFYISDPLLIIAHLSVLFLMLIFRYAWSEDNKNMK